MAVTLRWLIEGSTLENLRCVACPDRLDQPISSVNILDNPDVVKWLKKDELVLTSGYLLLGQEELQRRMIRELKAEGCAALGVKVHRYFQEIPPVMIEEARRIHFPLLELPFFYAFSDISRVVYNRLAAQSTLTARKEQRMLSGLTTLLFSGEPPEELVRAISRYFHTAALLVTPEGTLLAQHSATPESLPFPDSIPAFRMPEDGKLLRWQVRGQWESFRCVRLQGSYGALLLQERGTAMRPGDVEVLRHAAALVSLRLEQLRFARTEKIGEANSFFSLLVAGTRELGEAEAVQLCETYRFDWQKKRICLSFFLMENAELKPEEVGGLEQIAASFCENRKGAELRPFLCLDGQSGCLYLLTAPTTGAPELTAAARELAAALVKALPPESCVCISRCHQSVVGIRTAYQECTRLYELLHAVFPERRVYDYASAAAYRLLSQLPAEELRHLYLDTVEPLERFDRENNGELVRTLTACYENQFNVARTANALFIHRNTLMHRLDKMKELLYNDLRDTDDRMALYLGLCVARLLR